MEKKELKGAETGSYAWNTSEITEDMMAVSSMQCLRCGERLTGDAYIKVVGSIYVGEDGGIIGGQKDCTSRFCINCFIEELERVREAVALKLQNKIAELEEQMNKRVLKHVVKQEIDIPDFLKDMTPEQKTSVIRLIQNVTD